MSRGVLGEVAVQLDEAAFVARPMQGEARITSRPQRIPFRPIRDLLPAQTERPTPSSIPIALTDVDISATPKISTSLVSLNRVLGGDETPGMTPASIVLLTADPGAGKSTLLAQIAAAIGVDLRVLYVSGEETAEQVAGRAQRINACEAHVQFVHEHDIDAVFAHADALGVKFLIIDSIQAMTKDGGRAGTDNQIRTVSQAVMAFAKPRGITVWLIGHVTKDGNAAGPQTLAHDVDVTIHMHLDPDFQELRSVRAIGKNRFGPGAGGPVGMFRMTSTGLVDLDDGEASTYEDRRTKIEQARARDEAWEPLARELWRRLGADPATHADLRERFGDLDLFA
jgi:DNA repair protein RadA/Sms